MFDSKYYKKRFVYLYETGDLTLLEMNWVRNEAYIFSINKEDESKIDIRVRELEYRPLIDENLTPLKDFLIEYGYTKEDFSNKLTRTNKIIHELHKIGKEKSKVLKK